jgi:hypothetical protein
VTLKMWDLLILTEMLTVGSPVNSKPVTSNYITTDRRPAGSGKQVGYHLPIVNGQSILLSLYVYYH